MIDIKKANEAFEEYVKNFDISNELISLKYNHTYRVCVQSLEISRSIGLDEEKTKLAYLIALLHDIGRFEQAKKYNTFDDINSIDHADYGCDLLFKEGLIRKFVKDTKYDKIIEFAIRNHNKYEISNCDEETLLQSKIIRDADKIDIIYNASMLGQISINSDESNISDEVKQDFINYKNVYYAHKKTKNDRILTMLSFPFDLNFDYSFNYFKDNKFIDKIYNKIDNKEIFEPYIEIINNYIEGKCKNVTSKVQSKRSRKR